jgi:hypothetical protein
MKRILLYFVAVATLCLPGTLLAANGQADASVLSLATHLALFVVGALSCSVTLKIYFLLKGGELAAGWQMLTASFLLFSVGEVLNVAAALEIIGLQANAIRVLQVLALFLILLGVIKIKKSLS